MSTNVFVRDKTADSKVTDNFHLDFPARMSDGRQFTDYRSTCYLNIPEQKMTTYQYRQFLKHNAEKIMENFENINETISGCSNCSDYEIVPSYLGLTCDGEQCKREINADSGVGIYFKNNNE